MRLTWQLAIARELCRRFRLARALLAMTYAAGLPLQQSPRTVPPRWSTEEATDMAVPAPRLDAPAEAGDEFLLGPPPPPPPLHPPLAAWLWQPPPNPSGSPPPADASSDVDSGSSDSSAEERAPQSGERFFGGPRARLQAPRADGQLGAASNSWQAGP